MRILAAAAFALLAGAAQAQVGPLGPPGLPANRFPLPARLPIGSDYSPAADASNMPNAGKPLAPECREEGDGR